MTQREYALGGLKASQNATAEIIPNEAKLMDPHAGTGAPGVPKVVATAPIAIPSLLRLPIPTGLL